MKNFFIFLALLFLSSVSFGQEVKLDQYKYVIVSSKFDFVKQVDEYKTSSLAKFLFNKIGFKAYLDNEEAIPQELSENRCKALLVDVKDNSGMFRTKNFIELKNCRGKLVYRSEIGSSKLKSYERAYREAIKEAFISIEKLGYTYDSSLAKKGSVNNKVIPTTSEKKAIKVIKEGIDQTKKPLMVTKEVTTNVKEDSSYQLLYAQKNDTGFQLINTKPEIVFMLLKTNDAKKFIIKDKNGTLTDKGDYWLAEYYKNGTLVMEKYQIKF